MGASKHIIIGLNMKFLRSVHPAPKSLTESKRGDCVICLLLFTTQYCSRTRNSTRIHSGSNAFIKSSLGTKKIFHAEGSSENPLLFKNLLVYPSVQYRIILTAYDITDCIAVTCMAVTELEFKFLHKNTNLLG